MAAQSELTDAFLQVVADALRQHGYREVVIGDGKYIVNDCGSSIGAYDYGVLVVLGDGSGGYRRWTYEEFSITELLTWLRQ